MKPFSMVAAVLSGLSCLAADFPLLSLRIRDGLDVPKERLAPFFDVLGCYRGTFDDIWFCSGWNYAGLDAAEAGAENASGNLLPLCKTAGIDFSVQQGITLGHSTTRDWPLPGARSVGDDGWSVDRDGNRLVGIFCPRSPDALAYVADTVKATVSRTHPRIYWLDDDLRLGISKPETCFCARCLKAFNERCGTALSREKLVARLFDPKVAREPLRRQWIDFNAESLAVYGAAARKALDETGADTVLAYQSVWADTIYTGRDFRPLLDALSRNGECPTAIRPGAGWYREGEDGGVLGLVAKCLSVAREAERCRAYGTQVGSVCYENETYPRRFLNKSPAAQVTECALAMASGCDALSVYGYCGEDYARTNEFHRLYRHFAAARPYFERMRREVRCTRLGGIARYVGSRAAELAGFDLRDEADIILAQMGVPVTCAEAAQGAFYVTKKSVAESEDGEIAAVRARGAWEFDLEGGFCWTPTAQKREEILDKMDALVPGGLPVRLMESRTVRILPRVDAAGRTSSVTLFNLSIGGTDVMELRIRRPAGNGEVRWMSPDRSAVDFTVKKAGDELIVTIFNIPAGGIGTLFVGSQAFAWRGFMLDEARHFFGKDAVKSVLDRMAELKLNRFHWHLTDDQGWRLDIPGLPELVKCGAVRPSSPKPGTEAESDGTPYGPFYYTAADVREIVDYASARGITVVPEIEIPGHTRALLASHPEFACPGVEFEPTPWCEYGICSNVVCAGSDEMLACYRRIFDEVLKMFPGEYVHIGGDECPKTQWRNCPKCRARMESEGLADVEALQGWITRQMVEYVSAKGRRVIGWDEILDGGELPKGTIIQSWRGTKGGIAAAKCGYDVIMSPSQYLYFSIPEGRPDDHYPTRYWSRINNSTLPAEKVRSFDPLAGIPPEDAKHILGAECCLWTEVVHSPEELRFKAFNRLGAFAQAMGCHPISVPAFGGGLSVGGDCALTGSDGGRLAALADATIRVPENETYKVQEPHLPVYHALCAGFEDILF